MHEHDDLARRLGALGSAPVPEDVRAGHLHAMRGASPAGDGRRRFGRLAVAAAALAGFAVGSTGFAMAGALPAPAQGVAHDVLSVVQVDVPDRPANHGSCVSAAAKLDDPAAKQAAKEACRTSNPPGRPEGVGGGRPDGAGGGAPATPPGQVGKAPKGANADDDPCTGKPPWAGRKGGPNADEAAARAACPPDDG